MAGESTFNPTRTAIATFTEARVFTGFTGVRDVADADLTTFIAQAQAIAVADLAVRLQRVPMWGVIDGVNTRFSLPRNYAGFVFLDALNTQDEKGSILIFSRSVVQTTGPPTYTALTIASVDALHGQVVLTAAPSLSTVEAVEFTGPVMRGDIDRGLLKTAVLCLVGELVDAKVRGPGNVNLANPDATQRPSPAAPSGSWRSRYDKLMDLLRSPKPRAASQNTRLPSDYYSDIGDGWRLTVP